MGKWKHFFMDLMWLVIVAMVFGVLAYMLVSCSPKYITVPEYHTEYIVKTDSFIQRDTVSRYDSVMVRMAGDTVFLEKYKTIYREKWRERIVSDTILKTDSIRVPYPVEKKLTRWQNLCITLGGYAVGIIIALFILLVILMYYRWKKL